MLSTPSRLSKIARFIVLAGLFVAIGIDMASTLQSPTTVIATPVSQLKKDGVPADYATQVALVRSDDIKLPNPVSLETELTREQIIAMVYQVLESEGGLKQRLFPGAKVVIKPNIVEMSPEGDGVNTDPRVVEGLVRWLVANGPENLNITVAEAAGGWLASRMKNTKYNSGGAPVEDGFLKNGYTPMQQRLAADGIAITLLDANFGSYQDPLNGLRLASVPDWIDFPERPAYWIHEAILDADVLINVPVMKIHTPQITVCLKNYIGIAAGAKYGTYKGIGGPDPNDPPGLHQDWPDRNSIEHEIVDLASIAPSDYCLVDAIVCKERGKTASHPSVRRNMVLAGPDLVAIDTIAALLMGLNPDDVPHLCAAAREGLGTNDLDRIAFLSERPLEDSLYYFERTEINSQGNRGHFAMNNRVWLLNRFDGADINNSCFSVPDSEVIATPGVDGWTEPIYFSDDYIDFDAYYGSSDGNTFYAYCRVDVPSEQDAELWISHDESCQVWIGGEKVYESISTYKEVKLPYQSSKTIHLKAGEQPLLVKLIDRSRTAPFVMNICRILPTSLPEKKATYRNLQTTKNYQRYEGTRIVGLKFSAGNSVSDVPQWETY